MTLDAVDVRAPMSCVEAVPMGAALTLSSPDTCTRTAPALTGAPSHAQLSCRRTSKTTWASPTTLIATSGSAGNRTPTIAPGSRLNSTLGKASIGAPSTLRSSPESQRDAARVSEVALPLGSELVTYLRAMRKKVRLM